MLKLSGEQALPTKASVLPHTDFLPWEVIPQKILETHYRDPYSSQQQQESGQETAREAASFQQGSAEWDGDASSFGDHEPETTRFEVLLFLGSKAMCTLLKNAQNAWNIHTGSKAIIITPHS